MVSAIYQVRILNNNMSLTDWLAIISLAISFISVLVVLIDKYLAHKSKKMNLSCSLKSILWNNENERIFVFMIFSNNSSEPLLIPSVKVSLYKSTIPSDSAGNIGGLSLLASVPVEGHQYNGSGSNKSIDFKTNSLPFPITLGPYSSIGGFVAIPCGKYSSQQIPHMGDITFKIQTTRYPLIFEHNFSLHEADQYYYEGKNHVKGKKQK